MGEETKTEEQTKEKRTLRGLSLSAKVRWRLRYASLPFLFVFNPVHCISLLSALQIRRTGQGRIPNYDASCHCAPLASMAFVFWFLAYLGMDANFLGVAYILLLVIGWNVGTTKVNTYIAMLIGVIAVAMFTIVAILHWAGKVDAPESWRALVDNFGTGFPTRWIFVLAALFGIQTVAVAILAYVKSVRVTPETFFPGSIEGTDKLERNRFRLAVFRTWDDWLWAGAASGFFLPDDSTARSYIYKELQRDAVVEIPVLPAAAAFRDALEESRERLVGRGGH